MRQWVLFAIICMAVFIVIVNMLRMLHERPTKGRQLSLSQFASLCLVYVTLVVAFGCVYIALELIGFSIFVEGKHYSPFEFRQLLEDAFYFSAVTLLSLGYGDVTPIGIGRPVAIIQALIGYLIPAAFVVTSVINRDRLSE